MKKVIFVPVVLMLFSSLMMSGQWNTNGTNIYNTNSGNVGIGSISPTTLLHVKKNMTEPTITIQNLGGNGGATYNMIDNASGASWKFKATSSGGFKIRDHASSLDVIVIEPNSFSNAIYITSEDNIGIGTADPVSSALIEMSSTTKGFLPPRMTQSQILVITNPVDGLIVYCTSNQKFFAYNGNENVWKEISFGAVTLIPTCGTSVSFDHVAGTVAPVSKTVTYGTVSTNLSGAVKCWISNNLGSDHQASSATDNTEASAGWYWQFNRQQGYRHDGTTRTPNTTWVSVSENSNWLTAADPCILLLGTGWRLPTSTEWNNVDVNGGWDNYNETYASVLKLHAAGYLEDTNGSLADRGVMSTYNSSTQSNTTFCYSMNIFSYSAAMGASLKSLGHPSRCLKD